MMDPLRLRRTDYYSNGTENPVTQSVDGNLASRSNSWELDEALKDLLQGAYHITATLPQDSNVRLLYIESIDRAASEIRSAVSAGQLTSDEGYKLANELRNELLTIA